MKRCMINPKKKLYQQVKIFGSGALHDLLVVLGLLKII